MRGILACERCVIDYGWNCCTKTEGGFVDGHVAVPEDQVDLDSWSHLLERDTHRALVALHPQSGLLQRAEPYLRSLASRKISQPLATRLRPTLDEWDSTQRASRAAIDAPHPGHSKTPSRSRRSTRTASASTMSTSTSVPCTWCRRARTETTLPTKINVHVHRERRRPPPS
ncbi:hypothetical protein ACIBL5_36430 [Streptomyces sp. NPDC050516]|uniref:hypothetical protein n=1 Tax=Streptomyces sp. NPDC050516 TaxID=3365621 RepID=UPI0037B610FC